MVLVAFDLLHLDGRDLLETPLRERRAALEELAPAGAQRRALPLLAPRHGALRGRGGARTSTTPASDATRG